MLSAWCTAAVRQGRRDLHRPDLLARNPLLRTRLARRLAGGEPPDGELLAWPLRTGVDVLRRHPRDDKLLRAVERTYLRPAPNRQAAADVRGLPFSTYRRHLSQGVWRVVACLWDHELSVCRRSRCATTCAPGARSSTRRILPTLARVVDVPWELALGADLSLPGVEGPRPLRRRAITRYVTRLQAAAAGDPELSRAFVRVTGLVDRPQTLLRPGTALRVLRAPACSKQPARTAAR